MSARHALLTREQERDLGRRVQAGLAAARRIAEQDVEHVEVAELERVVADGREAERAFVHHNQGLAHSIAFRYEGNGLDTEDLVQYALIGVVRAARKFDGEKGFKFSTYATWWIRQSIQRGLWDDKSVIRLPVHVHHKLDEEPELQKFLQVASLDMPVRERSQSDHSASTLGDFIAAPEKPLGADHERAEVLDQLHQLFADRLTPDELDAAIRRFDKFDAAYGKSNPLALEAVRRLRQDPAFLEAARALVA